MRQVAGGRSRIIPGRPLLTALLLGISASLSPAAAQADQTVVSATVYPSSHGSVTHPSASLSTLGGCPVYAGSNPMYLYPGSTAFQLPPSTTWPMSTVLTCGLGLASTDVTSVQVLNPNQGFEAPLSSADLTDPGQYHDAASPSALPVVSVDGGEAQSTYTRPWLGGTDDNAKDQVTTANGTPITIVVYENAPPLQVSVAQRTISHTASAQAVTLTASVHDATGAPVAASALTWSWSFGDGTASSEPAPRHSFGTGSTYFVTVQVTDAGDGSGGTGTIEVSSATTGAGGSRDQKGATKPAGSRNPAGSDRGRQDRSPASTGKSKRAGTPAPTTTTTSPTSTTTTATTTTSATTTTATTSTTSTTPNPKPIHAADARNRPAPVRAHRRRATPRRPPPIAGGAELVTGRLVSDVTPLPAADSPLVQRSPPSAAAVRQATHTSPVPALAVTLAVILLLGLGAERELRGRRRWQIHRAGS